MFKDIYVVENHKGKYGFFNKRNWVFSVFALASIVVINLPLIISLLQGNLFSWLMLLSSSLLLVAGWYFTMFKIEVKA